MLRLRPSRTPRRRAATRGRFGPALAALALAACAPPKAVVTPDSRDRALLEMAVHVHWQGIRWNDPARACAALEDDEARLAYRRWMREEWDRRRVVDFSIADVELGPQGPADERGRVRTAEVRLQVEGYGMPEQVVRDEEVVESWYRTADGWWLDWTPPEDASEAAGEAP